MEEALQESYEFPLPLICVDWIIDNNSNGMRAFKFVLKLKLVCWLEENNINYELMDKSVQPTQADMVERVVYVIIFSNNPDATLFKMRWL